MPPIRNIEQTTETADGAVHYQSVAGVRVLQFACAVQGCSLKEWHAKRRELIRESNRDVLGDTTFVA